MSEDKEAKWVVSTQKWCRLVDSCIANENRRQTEPRPERRLMCKGILGPSP